jgi:hypothetical protein
VISPLAAGPSLRDLYSVGEAVRQGTQPVDKWIAT